MERRIKPYRRDCARLCAAGSISGWDAFRLPAEHILGHADPRMTARYAHVVDMAKRNPALFIPVKVG
jgi:integrase